MTVMTPGKQCQGKNAQREIAAVQHNFCLGHFALNCGNRLIFNGVKRAQVKEHLLIREMMELACFRSVYKASPLWGACNTEQG